MQKQPKMATKYWSLGQSSLRSGFFEKKKVQWRNIVFLQ